MRGILYKIECLVTGEIYFGSSINSLNKRMWKHKASYKLWKEGKYHFITSFNIIERGNYSFSLIETVECKGMFELHERERFYIENNVCINKVIPNRTKKEWDSDNKEHVKAYKEADRERSNELQRIRRAKNKQIKEVQINTDE